MIEIHNLYTRLAISSYTTQKVTIKIFVFVNGKNITKEQILLENVNFSSARKQFWRLKLDRPSASSKREQLSFFSNYVFSYMKWERLNVSQYRGKQTIFRLTLHFLRYAAQKENNLQPFDSAFLLCHLVIQLTTPYPLIISRPFLTRESNIRACVCVTASVTFSMNSPIYIRVVVMAVRAFSEGCVEDEMKTSLSGETLT